MERPPAIPSCNITRAVGDYVINMLTNGEVSRTKSAFSFIDIITPNHLFVTLNQMFYGHNLLLLRLNNRRAHTHTNTLTHKVTIHAVHIMHSHLFSCLCFGSCLCLRGFFWSGRGGGSRQRQIQLLRIKSPTNTWFSLLPPFTLLHRDSNTWPYFLHPS